LNVLVRDEEGHEAILSVLGPGELFCEMSVLDDGACSATVKASIPSVLVVIAKTVFMRCMQENFEVAHHVMRTLIERLRVANRRIESLALLDVSGRVARVLLEMAETVSGKQVVTRKTSRQDLAKMVGASRERVSRVVKDLELRGLIEEIDRRIILRGAGGRSASGLH
jgi:CRP/FNR family cyclic AMP-dependent transcriptional regulator